MGEPTIIKSYPRKLQMLVTFHLHSSNLLVIEINESPAFSVQRFRDGWRWQSEHAKNPQQVGPFIAFQDAMDSVWIEMSASLITMNDLPDLIDIRDDPGYFTNAPQHPDEKGHA